MSAITFRKGKDKTDRAAFVCGKACVPAAMITRLLKGMDGKSDTAMMRIFIAKLSGRYSDFMDAIDKAGLNYQQAIQEMKGITPKKSDAKPRITKEATAVAKMLCRKYAEKTPEQMLAAFIETTTRPEFKALVVDIIKQSLDKFGKNKLGKIRVRAERKGPISKGLIERAQKARAAKKKAK